MSCSEAGIGRRAALALLLGVLAGCGFRPVHGQNEGPTPFGPVALREADGPEDFAFRERMRRRVGHEPEGARLDFVLRFDPQGVAVTRQADITRYRLRGEADFRLTDPAGAVLAEGSVAATGGYDAGAGSFAVRAAERRERVRLSEELAELVAVRLLSGASRAGS